MNKSKNDWSINGRIDAYKAENEKILRSGDSQAIREMSDRALELSVTGYPVNSDIIAAKAFSRLLGRDVLPGNIEAHIGGENSFPHEIALKYNLDKRGWLYIPKGGKTVCFVDAAIHSFEDFKTEFCKGRREHIAFLVAVIAIIAAILLLQ